MSELTDLQICKRIAEIEGFEYYKLTDQGYMAFNEGINHSVTDRVFFNPITDDALCFQLMVKYNVKMARLWEENDGTKHYEAYINEYSSDEQCEKLPNKAICLSIIEAHKDK